MPPILPFIPSIIQGGLGLIKAITGGAQMNKAKMPASIRYDIPSGVTDFLTQTNLMAKRGLPGEDIIQGQIGSQAASAVGDVSRAYDSAVGAGGATRDIYMKSMDAIRDLGLKSAEYRATMQDRATQANLVEADYQDKAWEYNVNMPYQRQMNEYWGKKQAGMSNLWGGLDTMGSAAVSGYSGWQQRQGMQALIDAIKGIGSPSGEGASSFGASFSRMPEDVFSTTSKLPSEFMQFKPRNIFNGRY